MGVDIQIYRCRIGQFNCGAGPKLLDKSKVSCDVACGISAIGAVCFIGILLTMAGVEPNPGPTGAHETNNPKCKNWSRVAYGYRYVKTGLAGFISGQIGRRYNFLKVKVDEQCDNVKPCSVCTTNTLLPDHGIQGCNQKEKSDCLCQKRQGTRKKCPNNFCGHFYHLIVDDHVEKSPRWSSTDPTKWYTDHFQYAKCFLRTDTSASSLSDLDCADLLTIVINNEHINRNSIKKMNLFHQCWKDQDIIFNSGNFEVTDSELDIYFDLMIHVLEDGKCLFNDHDAMQAVKELQKLKNNLMQLTDKDIDGLLQKTSAPTFVFRYQYLLIEIGTEVMRKLFDVQVNQNFGHYLKNNADEKKQPLLGKLQDLIKKKCITAAQTLYLPPKDNNPTSRNFDISLLTCLLRNVCGLRPAEDLVWIHPYGHSVEEDIARLRDCRNNLSHSGTVFISSTDFTTKWNELCEILKRLNEGLEDKFRIKELQLLIEESQKLCIDENKRKDLTEIINAWKTMDANVIAELERLHIKVDSMDQTMKKILGMLTVKVTVDAPNQTASEEAQSSILGAAKSYASDRQDPACVTEVETACSNLLSDMEDKGVVLDSVEKGSILLTFRCPTRLALVRMRLYIADQMYQEKLTVLENAVSKCIMCPVKLNLSIVLEHTSSAMMQTDSAANKKSVVLTFKCRGSEGVRNAVGLLSNGSSTNKMRELSNALSRSVGEEIKLHTTVDFDIFDSDRNNALQERVKEYIFRYQYLLVELGTAVMRKVFDFKVGSDFVKYLSANNNKFYKQLQSMILAKTITADQAQYLPPIDKSPKSTNMDISLLACLLRNVCGLRGHTDPVWKNPPPTDFSIEADLARLKGCRNNLQHSGTVFISATDLTDKWNDLSQILNRLNTVCGIPNLSLLINDADRMDIDEELKDRHDQVIKSWTNMDNLCDSGVKVFKFGQSEIQDISTKQQVTKRHIENVEQTQLDLKHQKMNRAETGMQEISTKQQVTKRPIENVEQTHLDWKPRKLSMGRKDVFVCRYQYLLIEVGTKVLRNLFDNKVGNDFMRYLNANPTQSKLLKYLRNNNFINDAQKKLLPPDDMKPTSSNFDITLLALLLRNVCGLLDRRDSVWNTPAPGDLSVEADITRLRCCRYNFMHSDTVVIPETDFDDKWKELSGILTRLNKTSGITELSALIDNTRTMAIDEELDDRLDKTMNAWDSVDQIVMSKLDRGEKMWAAGHYSVLKRIKTVATGQQEVKQGLSSLQQEVKQGLSSVQRMLETVQQDITPLKSSPTEDAKDLKNRLVTIYKKECCTLSVSPLCDEDEDEVEILSIYKPPSLYHVPYHRTQEKEEKYSISSYKEIFCKDDRTFRKIYITGDAGVGKTSFCKRMTFLWCKSQCGESVSDKSVQDDIDFMAKFDFVFYISLRDTRRKDVVSMIIEQSFCNENDLKKKEIYECVDNILINHRCILIMDALDEWTPAERGKININKLLSDKCSFVMTCRPYKIENERLSPRDLDRQVQITGIKESSTKRYITELLKYINVANMDSKEPNDFIRDVNKCGLQGQLCIPIITSHLVAVWYYHKLTDMSRALIYSNIIDMLLKRAETRKGNALPSSVESKLQFPDSLSELFYFKKHISFLKKICLLSFNLLFKQDKCLSEIVFTTEQLQSEPYCISVNEMDFLCKFGILSKSKVIGRFGKREQKLSYLHKTYLEYFAALFVSSFDFDNVFDNIVKKWTTINDVVQFENCFIFFAGLSIHKSKILFENMYHTISDDLSLCRKNAIFHYDSDSYNEQIKSLQSMVINCFKEVGGSNDSFRLEDFIFDRFVHNDNCMVDHLKQILLLNTTCVKSIHSVYCKYYDEFDQIQNLQCLHVGALLSGAGAGLSCDVYDVKFTECMLQNQSTLHTVCIEGDILSHTLIPELPVRSLQRLTSLSLYGVKMQHNSLRNLVKFLSRNVLIENIKLSYVSCDNHPRCGDSPCTLPLNLPHHKKLTSLSLEDVNILCYHVNNSSLKSITLLPLSEMISRCYIDVFNCIKDSQLENFYIDGSPSYRLDNNKMRALAHTVNTLPYIKSLTLEFMKLPDDVLLQLHPDVTQVEIELERVTLSRQCFHCFIESCVNNKSVINVWLTGCSITSVDGETHRVLSEEVSVDYMSEYLTSIPTVNITYKEGSKLHFETGSCQ